MLILTVIWHKRAAKAIKQALGVIKSLPPLRLSQWAEQNFYLSSESSYSEGRWQSYPPQIFILDCMGNDAITELNIQKSARMGYTKNLMAAMAYFTCYRRRNQAIWQPTDADAQEFVETEYNPMLRDVKAITAIFPALGKKHAHNTNSYKHFVGCVTYIKGGSSARNFRRISVDVVILDEIDGFNSDIDHEGTPRKLAKKRTEGASFPKQICGSTPKLKYLSEIEASIAECDAVYRYHIPCPHCETFQALLFGDKNTKYGLKWHNNDPSTAAYCCCDCSGLFTQADYLKVWQLGKWIDANGNWYDQQQGLFFDSNNQTIEPPPSLGVDNYWTIYSPQATWVDIVKEYLSAVKKYKQGNNSDLKTFVNTTLGQTFEEVSDKTDDIELKKRAEAYALMTVPLGGLLLCAGIDVQKDRFEMVVWAFGRGEQMWAVDYQVIPANPAILEEWDKLDAYLLKPYRHVAGTALTIEHVGIDTGGHWTHNCYAYVRSRKTSANWTTSTQYIPRIYATKGHSTASQPISGKASLQDIAFNGKVIKQGIKLYLIGTDTAKDLFYGRLQVAKAGAGYVHFSDQLPDKFFEHLSNEVRIIKDNGKFTTSVWVIKKQGLRNEALDCTVMAMFCAHKIGLHKRLVKEWDLMESIVQPNQHDLFSIAMPSSAIPTLDAMHTEPAIISQHLYRSNRRVSSQVVVEKF